MSTLLITEIDVHDDAALAEWYAVSAAALREGLGDLAAVRSLAAIAVSFREPSRNARRHVYVGRADGAVVAAGAIQLPLTDNLDRAHFACEVDPAHRRRGHGSALLAFLEAAASGAGRAVMATGISWSDDHGSDGVGWAGREFALARGYRLALGDVERHLTLPVDVQLLDALAAEAAERHAGYELRSWVGPVPDELALGWETLWSSLMTEAPTGDSELEPAVADVANLREREAVAAKQGSTLVCTAAVTAAGEVAAYSDIGVQPDESGRAYQQGTLVRGSDRGHRLGMAVKVANLRLLQSLDLAVDRVVTWNAEVNEHMIDINVRLGFVPVARAGMFERRLEQR